MATVKWKIFDTERVGNGGAYVLLEPERYGSALFNSVYDSLEEAYAAIDDDGKYGEFLVVQVVSAARSK